MISKYPLEWKFNFDLSEIFKDIMEISIIIKNLIKDSLYDKERRIYKKIEKWNVQLEEILESIQEIQKFSIKSIEQRLNIKFRDPNKLIVALFTRTTKNLFLEMKQENSITYYYPNVFKSQILDNLINLGELAEGFATLGDSVLGLVSVHRAWEKGLFKKGDITNEKIKLERNSKLAQLCDDLNLDKYQISLVPGSKNTSQETTNHKKATFFEAITWIYYSENGFESVLSLFNKI